MKNSSLYYIIRLKIDVNYIEKVMEIINKNKKKDSMNSYKN